MPRGRRGKSEETGSYLRRATTPEGREEQLVAAAWDLAERQIHDGTASAQVITTFLKLGTSREKLEQQRLFYENELTKAKIENMASVERIEALYKDAIVAMSSYQGRGEPMVGEEGDVYDDDF